ncbi:MAG: hypothetical protein LBH06_08925 [Rikenellaceae bacterium]|nr:hypothetical protein [Rikenellaceae bacterium]
MQKIFFDGLTQGACKNANYLFLLFLQAFGRKNDYDFGRREMRLEMTGEWNMFAGLRHCFGVGV